MTTWPDPQSLPDLSDHQRERYADAAHGCLGIIGGRPGSGKTFLMARLIKALPQGRLAVCGPTGKSAVRVTETLHKAGVRGIRAVTVHSLLGPSRDDNGQWSFDYNEDNPLDLDWILLDEGSMQGCLMMGNLLAARPPGCNFVIGGDVNQLSPVNPGAPLRDLIAAGLPYGELTEIRRNAGRIVRACHGIVDKHRFEPSPRLDLDAESPENLLHVERREPDEQINALKADLEKFRSGATIAGRRIDPVWDCQVVVPVNEKSPLGRTNINRILQGFLNPSGETVRGNPFRVADKIVNGKNGWFPIQSHPMRLGLKDGGPWNAEQKEGKVYAANGEQGKVLAVFPTYTIARMWLPDRLIRIPRGNNGNQDENGEETGTGCEWDLAYALSVHKSQGSDWPVVITMADSYPGARMLCDRCWLYTALSRAQTLAITIGQRDVLDEMCGKSHIWNRKTFLVESIGELEQQSIARGFEEALA